LRTTTGITPIPTLVEDVLASAIATRGSDAI
jgi:hypothetical protein